jgi:hypothetical protein
MRRPWMSERMAAIWQSAGIESTILPGRLRANWVPLVISHIVLIRGRFEPLFSFHCDPFRPKRYHRRWWLASEVAESIEEMGCESMSAAMRRLRIAAVPKKASSDSD